MMTDPPSRRPRRSVRWIVFVVLSGVILIVGVLVAWRLGAQGHTALAGIPLRPDLGDLPPEMEHRVTRCEFRIRFCLGPTRRPGSAIAR